ncbi:hypothetical protein K8I61_17650 [bacterium]|nr:hypothetical protein [bacterium]
MSKGGKTNKKSWEDSIIDQLDRAREGHMGPKEGAFDEGVKKRLHDCQPGDWVKQVLAGTNNYGPPLRVLDPKKGEVENRSGIRSALPPRSQVMTQE